MHKARMLLQILGSITALYLLTLAGAYVVMWTIANRARQHHQQIVDALTTYELGFRCG